MVVVIKKTDSLRVIDKKLKSLKTAKTKKKFDAYKHLGRVKFKEDPNEIQKKLRDEWR